MSNLQCLRTLRTIAGTFALDGMWMEPGGPPWANSDSAAQDTGPGQILGKAGGTPGPGPLGLAVRSQAAR